MSELRNASCFATKLNTDEIVQKFPSYTRTFHFIAYWQRFSRKKLRDRKIDVTLTMPEIDEAERQLLKLIQNSCFHDDIERVSSGVQAKSKKP